MNNKNLDRDKLESAINGVVDVNKGSVKVKKDIPIEKLLILKHAVSPINNLITHELTLKFIETLPNITDFVSKDEDVPRLKDKYKDENVNANGFDFYDAELNIVAEIKANIPYGKNQFGSAQLDGIRKDIKGMLDDNIKKKKQGTTDNFFKFQVMLGYEKDGYSTNSAVDSFCRKYKGNNVTFLNNNDNKLTNKSDREKVYVIIIELNKQN